MVKPVGGTAIAVMSSIRYDQVNLPPRLHLEATVIELLGALGGILVVSAYKKP